MSDFRTETDSLGSLAVPRRALYGIHTCRAQANFPITGTRLTDFPELVRAMVLVKKAAAAANAHLGALPDPIASAILSACDEILAGNHLDSFVVDMVQGGAGTSTNMNANEVIANLACLQLGQSAGDSHIVHPIDHVNLSQSTNDTYPTAIRLAILDSCVALTSAQSNLADAFRGKAEEFSEIRKVGRTQLQDAVPMTLGAEFGAFATSMGEDIDRVRDVSQLLTEVNLGGTAIGTRVNAPAGYQEAVVEKLSAFSGHALVPAADLVEASADVGALMTFSGILKRNATKLSKICNDLRLMSSGPRAGLGEINLPAVQAGSSIMPGKVNPVIPEVVNQVAYLVIGNDLTVTMAAEAGQFQLNAMEPIIAFKVLESIRAFTNAMTVLETNCISGITANSDRCSALLSGSLCLSTALVPALGYEHAAQIAKRALVEARPLIDVAKEHSGLSDCELSNLLER